MPVGLAWQDLLGNHPHMTLHDKDNSHPNIAGTYLAACVFFSTLFHQSPEGLQTQDNKTLDRFVRQTALLLQKTAWHQTQNHR